jgi:hypothetical protein
MISKFKCVIFALEKAINDRKYNLVRLALWSHNPAFFLKHYGSPSIMVSLSRGKGKWAEPEGIVRFLIYSNKFQTSLNCFE